MRITAFNDVSTALKNDCRAFIIHGDNDFYKRKAYHAIIHATVGKAPSEFAMVHFDDKNMDFEEIHAACEIAPFMCERKCVCVVDPPLAQMADADLQLILDTISDMPPYSTLIFYCIADDFDLKKAKTKKIVDAFSASGCDIVFTNKNLKNTAQSFVSQRVKECGCSISRPNAAKIVEKSNGDFETMDREIAKLCAYKPDGSIEEDDIEKLFSLYLASTVFELTKCIFAGNYEGAFQKLYRLKAQKEEPIAVLAELSSGFLDYYRALMGKRLGKKADEIKEDFNYRANVGFRMDNAYAAAYKYRDLYLRKCIRLIYQADLTLKSENTDPYLVLEQLLTRIFAAKEEYVS